MDATFNDRPLAGLRQIVSALFQRECTPKSRGRAVELIEAKLVELGVSLAALHATVDHLMTGVIDFQDWLAMARQFDQPKPAKVSAKGGAKIADALVMMRRPIGASDEEIMLANGWNLRTTRTTVSRLRKSGIVIRSERSAGRAAGTVYFIDDEAGEAQIAA